MYFLPFCIHSTRKQFQSNGCLQYISNCIMVVYIGRWLRMDLVSFFKEYPVAALGFSGGVDSSYLLYSAMHYGAKIKAYYVRTAFQPQFELDDAVRLAKQLGADMAVIETDVLSVPRVAENPPDRCYYCKTAIFSLIRQHAADDGYHLLIDGTNASDDAGDRPGILALQELSIRSPLKECGLRKSDIRRLSREAGLFTWNKPAYACLATRIPAGTVITEADLHRIEHAEDSLFAMGFTDFRVRMTGRSAKIQLPASQMPMAIEKQTEIMEQLQPEFESVLLDMAGRRNQEI